MTTTQPTCLNCMNTGEGVQFPLTPKSGAKFGTICADCDSTSEWSQNPLLCYDCEEELSADTAHGNRAYGEPRCEACHIEYRNQ